MARNMLDAMLDIDPAGVETYTANYRELDRRLDSLDRQVARTLRGAPRSFAVWHPSLSYFARDYGLDQLSVGFENKEMPARHLAQVTDSARARGVRVFFFQKEYDSRQAEVLNRQMGTRLVTVDPLAADFDDELVRVASELAK